MVIRKKLRNIIIRISRILSDGCVINFLSINYNIRKSPLLHISEGFISRLYQGVEPCNYPDTGTTINTMLKDNISAVISRINSAASRSERHPDEIKLVVVSKTVGVEAIESAMNSGLMLFGENRVQEAIEKIKTLKLRSPNNAPEWHLIGHLQRNKAKYVVGLFELIHSVDSIALADELQRQTEKSGLVQRILVEVKLSDETTKHGIAEEELEPLLQHIMKLKGLALEGLMTIPPFFEEPEQARPYFRRLKELRDAMQNKGFHLAELSMGMSNDFEVAIEEGATLVRVGTAIFGERG